ncbi:MAG: hypothetical protein WCJ64_22360 [Rhodospirillaceae bacterium]
MTFLTTDAQFLAAEFEYLRLIALSAATSDTDMKGALAVQSNAQLASLFNSIPVSNHSAAAVVRTLANPAVSLDQNARIALALINSYLTAPFT